MLIRIKRRIEKQVLLRVLVLALVTFSFTPSFTQLPHLDRLSKAIFDVEAPSSRVTGTPGSMVYLCLLYTSPSPRDGLLSRMPSSA